MPIDYEVRGLIETQRKMEQVVRDLHGAPMLDAMRSAVLLVDRDAKKGAPVDTGRLRASITPEVRTQGNDVLGVVGSNVEYAPFVELGTKPHWPPISALEVWARRHGTSAFVVARAVARHGTKPKKYLQNAFIKNAVAIQRKIGDGVAGIVNK